MGVKVVVVVVVVAAAAAAAAAGVVYPSPILMGVTIRTQMAAESQRDKAQVDLTESRCCTHFYPL